MSDAKYWAGLVMGLNTQKGAGKTRGRLVVIALWLWLMGSGIVSGQPYGLETRSPIGPFLNNALPPQEQSAAWGLVEAFPNLTFDNPVCFTAEPFTNRLYVCTREGRIFFFTNHPATTNKTLFLDLSAVTLGVDDAGLFGFVFHPEYGIPGSTNRGYVYVYHNYTPALPGSPGSTTPSYNRLVRYTVPDGSLVADPNSALVLIQQFDENWWHNGGGLFFGTDGFLYLSMGDEGLANDAFNNSQKINSGLFSGVLRIDVDKDPTRSHPIRRQPQNGGTLPNGPGWVNSFTTNYFIPNDNPWQDPGGSVLEEFYAIGLRSPHRMTQDPVTGRVWLGDVGQDTEEEVNLIEAGGNYQWAYKEGTVDGDKPKPSPLIGMDKVPLYAYGRTEGNCVIGGYVYRGAEHAAYLFGKYIFGDNGSGNIWAMDDTGELNPPITYLCTTPPGSSYNNLSSFGLDQNGEIYVLVMGAGRKIYKLARTVEQAPPPPALLSQTGVFTNLATLAPNPALLPYTVNTPLWSDGAAKWRWMAVPNDGAPYTAAERISFTTAGAWQFPTGTVFVKHFALPTNETNPSELKRLETRLLTRGTNGNWYGLTYKWRDDNSDADLLSASLNETNFITTTTGIRTQVWYYPSRQDCLRCHTPNAGSVLGPRTCQMNGDFTYPETGVTDNQLRTLNHLSLFNTNLNEAIIPNYPRTASITDTNASLELRVRSYLDANCAHCHRPNGVRAFFDARFDTPLNDQGIIGRLPINDLGVNDAKIIAPLSPAQSVMHLRMNSVSSIKMPPVAKNLVDDPAVALLTAWINSLPPVVPLPQPWVHQEIGPVGVPGHAAYDYATNRFTVNASGTDIWGSADSFGFVYRPFTNNNVTITARIASMASLPSGGLAGVMIRQSLTEGSIHLFNGLTVPTGILTVRRTTDGGSSSAVNPTSGSAPYWVRITRNGNTLTAYHSVNGTTWPVSDTRTIPMTGTIYVGLAYTSVDNNVLGTATFDNVSITGTGINNPPIISPVNPQTINENTNTGPLAFTVRDQETAASSLTLTATSSVPALVPLSGIVFGGSGTNRTVTVTPATNAYGSTTIGVSVSDGTNNVTMSFAVNVNQLTFPPSNQPPVISGIAPQSIAEDTSTTALAFTINDAETPAASLTLNATSSVPALVPVSGIVFGGSGTNRTVTITPLPDAFGTTTITLKVNDGTNETSTAFTVEVLPVNDLPTISTITNHIIAEDANTGALALTIGDVETAATSLTLTATSSVPAVVALDGISFGGAGANRTVTVAPVTNAYGTTTITLTVSDGTNEVSTAFDVEVVPVNDPPIISPITNQTIAEDISTTALTFTVSDVETEATSLTLTATSSVPAVVALEGIILGGAETNRTVTVTPVTNAFGLTTITLTVSDGTNEVSTVFEVEVLPVNDLPVISVITNQTIAEDTSTAALAFTVSDVETEATSLTLTATSSVPAVVALEGIIFGGAETNRTVTVTPVTNAFGLTTITLTISDGTNEVSTAFDVEVVPVNDPPVAWPDLLTRWMTQGTSVPLVNLITNDTDVEAHELTITSVTELSAGGVSVVTSNNWLFYAPVFGSTNEDSFSYVISDGHGGSATGLVTIAVQPDPAWADLLAITTTATNAVALQLQGLPGFTYTVQSSGTLQPPAWQNLIISTANETGLIEFTDPNPGGNSARYYRAVRGVVPEN